jgi:ubiquinone/menaquinone biosynthesis C-methylase UbiE
MAESFESTLRKAMEALGRVVEQAIGKAKRAKVQVGSRSGVQPVLSLESLLPPDRMKEIIEEATKSVLAESIPDIKGGTALEIGEGPALYGRKLLGSKASNAVAVEVGGKLTERQNDATRGFVIQAKPSRLPFQSQSFDYVLGRLATPHQGDIVKAVTEIGRVLAPGGQGVIVEVHPFGLYAKRGPQRMKSIESNLRKFEEYYRLCRKAGLRVVNLREAFVEEGMRKLFAEGEISAYRSLKNTPILAFFFIYKLRRISAKPEARRELSEISKVEKV